MKKQSKVLALVLTLVLAFVMTASLAVTALADTDDGYTITINGAVKDHTYTAYQIFSGTVATDNVTLTGIEWGDGVKGSELLAALQADDTFKVDGKNIFADCETADAVASALAANANNADIAKQFARQATDFVDGDGKSVTATGDTAKIEGVEAGYYLVVDDGKEEGTESFSLSMLKVVGNATVSVKASEPSVEKKVKDRDDSVGTETKADAWEDSADHDIGDEVEFQLKGTLPNTYDDYTRYKYVFHDKMSDGLTLDEDSITIVIKNGEKEVEIPKDKWESLGISVATDSDCTDGCTFEVRFNNLKAEALAEYGITSTTEIYVRYTAELNENANIGAEGNPNEVNLEYSNNPNYKGKGGNDTDDDEDEPTGETPEDKVIVFTYELDNTKVDGSDNATTLEGAEFDLYKWYADKNDLPEGKVAATDGPANKDEKGAWVKVGSTVTGTDGKIEFKGLDDGYYALVETKAPDGYNLASDPFYFEITAEHDNPSDDPKLTDLKVTNQPWTATKETGKIEGNIANNKGTTLPETGGMGTTIFYIIGGLLVVSAGVLLITKHRMSSKG